MSIPRRISVLKVFFTRLLFLPFCLLFLLFCLSERAAMKKTQRHSAMAAVGKEAWDVERGADVILQSAGASNCI